MIISHEHISFQDRFISIKPISMRSHVPSCSWITIKTSMSCLSPLEPIVASPYKISQYSKHILEKLIFFKPSLYLLVLTIFLKLPYHATIVVSKMLPSLSLWSTLTLTSTRTTLPFAFLIFLLGFFFKNRSSHIIKGKIIS